MMFDKQTRKEIKLVACCWAALAMLFMFVQYGMTLAALIAFFAFGAFSEAKKGLSALFSETRLVVPLVVLFMLFVAHAFMFLDGQIFTQKLVSVVLCLVCIGMLLFYGIRGSRSWKGKALAVALGAFSVAILGEKLRNVEYAYKYQTHFNQSSENSH